MATPHPRYMKKQQRALSVMISTATSPSFALLDEESFAENL
jgi:hypothetical protein